MTGILALPVLIIDVSLEKEPTDDFILDKLTKLLS